MLSSTQNQPNSSDNNSPSFPNASNEVPEDGFSLSDDYQSEKLRAKTEAEKLKSELNKAKSRNSHIELQIANEKRKTAEANKRAAQANAQAFSAESKTKQESTNDAWKSKVENALQWLRIALLFVLLLATICVSILGLYYLFRLATEKPIIKTVTETVTETIEKNVIPEECTQVRRNGKVYVSCDGVTVKGAPTLADSGVDKIPELITE